MTSIEFGLAEPGFVRAPSGLAFALLFIGGSGEPFPSGVAVYAVVDALEPIDDSVLDDDLWAILFWMIGGVGAPWTRHDLEETGRLYRVPAAMLMASTPARGPNPKVLTKSRADTRSGTVRQNTISRFAHHRTTLFGARFSVATNASRAAPTVPARVAR